MKRKNHTARRYEVTNVSEAWNKVNEIFPTDYEKDCGSSERAGYPVYRSTAEGHVYDYVCDLGTRLEVNLSTGETINVWIVCEEAEPAATETHETDNNETANEAANLESRHEIAGRLSRICTAYTADYLKELENSKQEQKAVENMKNGADGEIRCVVMTAEHNMKVMLGCMEDCITAIRILNDHEQDVDEWMLVGISAMLDRCTKDRSLPFDLPTSICGLLCADHRKF